MSDSVSQQFLLMGLPGTGKTSFLAALWYMVNQSEIPCALFLDRYDGDVTYLNLIRTAWLEHKPVPRNPLDSEKLVSMLLKQRASSALVELTFPDLSGESFRLQWAKRQMTSQYDQRLRNANGAILFVHPQTISKPHRIDTADALVAAIGDALGVEGETTTEAASAVTKPWDIEKAPTQVQLVELLQFISGREYFQPPFRLAIIVSAWDLVAHLWGSAREWISHELPLLHEFLDSNEDEFQVEVYGVSAQGGRYASSLLEPGNFSDVKAFAVGLSRKGDPVSAWLWEQLGADTQVKLISQGESAETIESTLIRSLNAIMAKASIYDDERFKNIGLRPETKEILKGKSVQIGEETIRLNRLLLEDAYSTGLTRTRQYAEEALELQRKAPGRRVSLVGSNISNAHDITEPVLWLMR